MSKGAKYLEYLSMLPPDPDVIEAARWLYGSEIGDGMQWLELLMSLEHSDVRLRILTQGRAGLNYAAGRVLLIVVAGVSDDLIETLGHVHAAVPENVRRALTGDIFHAVWSAYRSCDGDVPDAVRDGMPLTDDQRTKLDIAVSAAFAAAADRIR
jgi:hypothetical protein